MTQTLDRILAGLNDEQRQAVTTTQGPVLIIAGPGSGKTRVIIQRIAYLIEHMEVDPQRILAVTFTNKAAAEMIERLGRVVPPEAARATQVSTFHKFCGLMTRRYSAQIGLNNKYSIYDREDQLSVIKRAMEHANVQSGSDGINASTILSKISLAKSRLLTPDEYEKDIYEGDDWTDYASEAAADCYHHYQRELEMANALDFDDMINRTVQILKESDRARNQTHRRYLYIMVDEFQDTNHAQNVLTHMVTGEHRNICVVGDPNQSIYGWRNADIANILTFPEQYPNTTTINLGRNYRSTEIVVKAAEGLISHNRQRSDNPLTAMGEPGEPIRLATTQTADDEAAWTVDQMQELIRQGKCRWKDCAIMYRLNAQSRPFEEICIRREIPYRLIGGIRFYQRREVKDLLAYLKIIQNPGDNVSLQRIINTPPRKIGATTVRRLLEFSDTHRGTLMQSVGAVDSASPTQERPDFNQPTIRAVKDFHRLVDSLQNAYSNITLAELIDMVLTTTGLDRHIKDDDNGQERWDNVMEIRALTEQEQYKGRSAEEALPDFLEAVSLVADVDQYDPEEGVMTLITLHQAKGLEFEVVAMPGMTEGVIPLGRSDDIEEERRLCYVGITRAKSVMLMSWPEYSNRYGTMQENTPSRFLTEIPAQYVIDEEYFNL